jgi:hypothetical protein
MGAETAVSLAAQSIDNDGPDPVKRRVITGVVLGSNARVRALTTPPSFAVVTGRMAGAVTKRALRRITGSTQTHQAD